MGLSSKKSGKLKRLDSRWKRVGGREVQIVESNLTSKQILKRNRNMLKWSTEVEEGDTVKEREREEKIINLISIFNAHISFAKNVLIIHSFADEILCFFNGFSRFSPFTFSLLPLFRLATHKIISLDNNFICKRFYRRDLCSWSGDVSRPQWKEKQKIMIILWWFVCLRKNEI